MLDGANPKEMKAVETPPLGTVAPDAVPTRTGWSDRAVRSSPASESSAAALELPAHVRPKEPDNYDSGDREG
jgi:hypothetical protein